MEHRRPHTLAPTQGEGRPGNIIWFDTETRQRKNKQGQTVHTLRLGVAIYMRRFKRTGYKEIDRITFYDYETFIQWVSKLCRDKTTTYLVAHNVTFDLSIVHAYQELAEQGWVLQSFYSKATTSIFRWRRKDARLIGMDNMNLFTGKLERWGKIFGFPKGHVDFTHVKDAELETYCTRDVEIMVRSWLAWLEFLDEHDLGNFKITTASTAFSAWRHRFMTSKVFIHVDPEALQLEREAYHGGRTECFYVGPRSDGPYFYVDVNNMYGYVLSKFEYPSGFWKTDTQPSLSRLLRKLEKQAVVARVLVNVTDPVFPVMEKNNVTYPVGTFITTLTTPELIYAFTRGWLADVYSMAWYNKAPLFRSYIEAFHSLRMQYRHAGNEGYEQISKLMMNALYGKFGQSGFDQKRIGDANPSDAWSQLVVQAQTGETYRLFALGGGVYEEHKTGESANSFPGIAAHVTAYARLYLWELITLAGRSHVYYCDTDSMILDAEGLRQVEHLIDPDKLGYLKIEHTSQTMNIHAPKDYVMGDRVRVKGVKLVDGKEVEGAILQDHWQRLGGQLQAHNTNDFIVSPVMKHLSRRIRSGVVSASGWVVPFRLDVEPGLLVAAQKKHLFELLQSA